jgi:hypothetical protein
VATAAQQATIDLAVTFGSDGITSIMHGPVELIDPSEMAPSMFTVRQPNGDGNVEQAYEPRIAKQTFDSGRKTLTQSYDWGVVQYAYTVSGDRIDERITITNTGQKKIADFNLLPMKFHLPRTEQNLDQNMEPSPRNGAVLVDGYGKITVIDWDFTNSPVVGPYRYETPSNGQQLIPISLTAPQARIALHPIVDNEKYFNTPGRPILPGKTDTYHISFLFSPSGVSTPDVPAEYYAAFAKANPMKLSWPDRRPIGDIFLSMPYAGWKTNPRGYLFGKGANNDITTPEGLAVFSAGLNQYADECVKNLKAMNAQGVIVWDLEGQEFWQPLSYMGDPRMLPQVAPEMDRLADGFFKKFTDAGLRVGVCIRPTEIYYREGQTPRFWHRDVKDPVALMSEKIAYAHKRWGATLFYLDSSVFGDGFDTKLPPNSNVPWVMPSVMLQQLNDLHPDCLVIPEESSNDDFRFCAPYASQNLFQVGTDPAVRRFYPDAFSVVAISSGTVQRYWDDYVSNVEGGDVLLFPSWFQAQEDDLVRLIYREAAIRKGGIPAALKNASIHILQTAAQSPNEGTRYYAASLLGKLSDPTARPALIGMLDDLSPLVRKSALVALTESKQAADPALIEKLAAWISKPSNPDNDALRPFAADLIGSFGEASVPDLLMILKEAPNDSGPFVYRAMSETNTKNNDAISLLLQPVLASVGSNPNEEMAITALGDLKAQAAVPALIAVLNDNVRDHESIRQAAVIALGKIGDPSAVAPLIAEFNKTYSTIVVYAIQQSLNTSLSEITGQTSLVGKDDWQRWRQRSAGPISRTSVPLDHHRASWIATINGISSTRGHA